MDIRIIILLSLMYAIGRPLSWQFSSTRASSSAPIVVRQLEATSCVLLPIHYSFPHLYEPKANRVTDKLTHVHDRIYCCRSGSAADTQAVADIVHNYLQLYTYVFISQQSNLLVLSTIRQIHGAHPPVSSAAGMFQDICYDNKDALSAGIIVAGWDKEVGPSVYNIPLGGGLFRQPWAIGGVSCMFHVRNRVSYILF
jgi:hypothetical protein